MYINNTIKELKDLSKCPTSKTMFDTIWQTLKRNNANVINISKKLDYAIPSSLDQQSLMFNEEWPVCKVNLNTGDSEGIYIDCYLEFLEQTEYINGYERSKRINIGTFKTLDDGIEAYGYMGQLSGYLLIIMEQYIFINYN